MVNRGIRVRGGFKDLKKEVSKGYFEGNSIMLVSKRIG
jgi:hypothetical protein